MIRSLLLVVGSGIRFTFSCIWAWRRGNAKDTKGTGFVVYEDILDAKNAVEHLTGFNVGGRYQMCYHLYVSVCIFLT